MPEPTSKARYTGFADEAGAGISSLRAFPAMKSPKAAPRPCAKSSRTTSGATTSRTARSSPTSISRLPASGLKRPIPAGLPDSHWPWVGGRAWRWASAITIRWRLLDCNRAPGDIREFDERVARSPGALAGYACEVKRRRVSLLCLHEKGLGRRAAGRAGTAVTGRTSPSNGRTIAAVPCAWRPARPRLEVRGEVFRIRVSHQRRPRGWRGPFRQRRIAPRASAPERRGHCRAVCVSSTFVRLAGLPTSPILTGLPGCLPGWGLPTPSETGACPTEPSAYYADFGRAERLRLRGDGLRAKVTRQEQRQASPPRARWAMALANPEG